ncbi:MAG TPA: response regulator transcription factor [Candidatus Acidoferrum sp.]|nr:response regulator transcription factor [Candidatus Acidoferrum sp.]
MSRILIVEDEEHLAQGLRFNLEAEGHQVDVTEKGEEALKKLLKEKQEFDALVLDVMLPGKDGFAVARELRDAQNFIPVLMLTARGRQEDILKGFEAGADDYLPKPFNLKILLARLDSMLRRKKWARKENGSEAPAEVEEDDLPRVYTFGGKTIDFVGLKLQVGNKTMQLTLMETELLRYLIRRAGQPVSRKAILEDVWDLREDTDTRAIDNFIVRLRKYIEKEPSQPRHLLTVRGVGYEFVPNPK